jgi:hypothetical protein
MAKPKEAPKRSVRCYLCGTSLEVGPRAMSTTCPGCHKAIKIEDLEINTYVPVLLLQTCGSVHVTRKGRVSAKRIMCGGGVLCEGSIEGSIETDGEVRFGPHASWKGQTLQSGRLEIEPGARLIGVIKVPWTRPATAIGPPGTVRRRVKTPVALAPAEPAVLTRPARAVELKEPSAPRAGAAAARRVTGAAVAFTRPAVERPAALSRPAPAAKASAAPEPAAAKKSAPRKPAAAKKTVAKKPAAKKTAVRKAAATAKTAGKKKTVAKKAAPRKGSAAARIAKK